jgi:hypothetical protein
MKGHQRSLAPLSLDCMLLTGLFPIPKKESREI